MIESISINKFVKNKRRESFKNANKFLLLFIYPIIIYLPFLVIPMSILKRETLFYLLIFYFISPIINCLLQSARPDLSLGMQLFVQCHLFRSI